MRNPLLSAVLLALLVSPFSLEAQPAMTTAEPTTTAAANTADARMHALLEWSRENKRGISIHLDGDVIHGVVKELLADAVVMSNQERATIIVRRERISAIAGQ